MAALWSIAYYSVFMTPLGKRYYYYPYFTDEETEGREIK